MAKPEWGAKRSCTGCGARFYDLHRDPITCPKCGAAFKPETVVKPRRGRATAAAAETKVAEKAVAKLPVDKTIAPKKLEVEEEEPERGETEKEDLIEDASELGEDEDDMAEVIEGIGEDEEEER